MSASLITTAAVWLGPWLRGAAGSDDVLEAMTAGAPDAPPVGSVRGAPPGPLTHLLGAFRRTGADSTWLLLPRPGSTIGWPSAAPGPPVPAVLFGRGDRAVGLLHHAASGWRWDPVDSASLHTVQAGMLTARSGARALAQAVTAAADRLEPLGLERPATRGAPRRWTLALRRLPRGMDPEVEALLVRLAALHDALDLALVEEGAAVTAGEARARQAAVQTVVGQVEDVISGVVGGLNAPLTAFPEPDASSATTPAVAPARGDRPGGSRWAGR